MEFKKKNYLLVLIILLVMFVLNLLSFFKTDTSWELETLKVGGSDNMKLVQQLYESESYIAQQTAAIDQALAQIGLTENMPEDIVDANLSGEAEDNIDVEGTNNTLIEELKNIKSSGIINGKANARFTILEYSELLCPYCKRQSDQGTIDAVIAKYPNEVNSMFRNFIVHGPAAKLAEVVKCVGELKVKSEHEFIKAAFAAETTLDVDSLIEIAGKLGVDKADLKNCTDSGKYTADVNNETSEGRRLFAVSGTPGNVIIDNETGKFALIPGAYPAEKFIEEIEKLKNN